MSTDSCTPAYSHRKNVATRNIYRLANPMYKFLKLSSFMKQDSTKTYNSRYSPVVTHLTTNPPVEGLTCGEQTGSGVVLRLWSYVLFIAEVAGYIDGLGM
jgi:hypothetical protein